MKKIIAFILITMLPAITACNSENAQELEEYHKDYVENVNKLSEKIDVELEQANKSDDLTVVYNRQIDNVLPLVYEVQEFIESQNPESDLVKEIHDIRIQQMNAWVSGFEYRLQALEKSIEGAEEEEVTNLLIQSEMYLLDAEEAGKFADDALAVKANEYNIILVE